MRHEERTSVLEMWSAGRLRHLAATPLRPLRRQVGRMNTAKSILRGLWSLVPIVGMTVSATLLDSVPMTIFWAAFVLEDQIERQANRIIAAVRDDKVGAALMDALRRPTRNHFRSGGTAS